MHDENFTIMSNVNYSSMYILIYQNVLQCITNLLYNILESEIWESMKYSINKAKKKGFSNNKSATLHDQIILAFLVLEIDNY